MRSQFGKDYDAKFQMVNVDEIRKGADTWGGRIHSPFAAESDNICWEFVWYVPEAFSIPHYHPKSESNYFVDFAASTATNRKFTAYIGWPISEAKVYEITEPTLLLIPAHTVHTFSNDGDGDLFLLHAFSPPWIKDLGQTSDLFDMQTEQYFSDGEKYGEFATEMASKYKNINELWDEYKRLGIY